MRWNSFITLVALILPCSSFAAFSPQEVSVAGSAKHNVYVSDSIISGGDALANPVVLSGIRWAPNSGFERIVVDLAGEGPGWESKTPPYFQVGIDPKSQKLTISIRGVSKRQLSQEKLAQSLTKSSLIKTSYLTPGLEGDLATVELQTAKPVEVESFYLVSPPRIILDVKAKK